MTKENRAHWQNDQRWQTAFENSAIGIMMVDFDGRFCGANSAFLSMLGYTESELYQLTFVDVTYEDDRKRNLELVRELVEGKRQHFQIEKRYYRKDRTLLWVRTNVALVPGMGGVAPFWFGIVEDITQRKRVEEELGFQIEVLQKIPAMVWTVISKVNFFSGSGDLIRLRINAYSVGVLSVYRTLENSIATAARQIGKRDLSLVLRPI